MNTDRQSDLPLELKAFAANLAALSPSSGGLNRDELMYRAGWEAHAAMSPAFHSIRLGATRWLWPLTTAALVLISAALSFVLATREPAVQIVYVEKPQAWSAEAEKRTVTPAEPIAGGAQPLLSPSRMIAQSVAMGNDYFSLRDRVLTLGIDELPEPVNDPSHQETPAIRDSRYGTMIGELRGG
jgi:hypothetical protein